MEKPNAELVQAVATLLCQEAACHTDFMHALAEEMQKRGYALEAHQRGIVGTWLKVGREV